MRYIMHALWATAMVISIGCQSDEESDIDKLVEASKAKRTVGESDLIEKPFKANDIPRVESYIKMNPNYTSYHLLLALRKHHPEEYKNPTVAKAQVLCSTLENTKWLNDWSTLSPSNSVDSEIANSLLEIGKESIQHLVPLLDDANRAKMFGSADASISAGYKYRRKDFAYRYIMLILGEQPTFHADPKKRDKDIEALKAKLKKDAK